MKKQMIKIVAVIALIATAGWNITQSEKEGALSDLALENIEALADPEEGDKGSGQCYNSITTQEGCLVLYCGTCTWISGTKTTFSGTSYC